MALKPTLSKAEFDALGDALKAEYQVVSKDGTDTYVLDVTEIDAHPRVAGLKSAFEKNKRDLETFKTVYDKFKDAGDLDLEQARAALARVKELEEDPNKSKEKQNELDALRQRLETTHTRAIEQLKNTHTQELTLRDSTIRELTIDNELDKAISAAGFDQRYLKAARAELILKQPKVVQRDGKFVGIYETDLGEVPISDFVRDFARSPDAEIYMPPSDKGGSGAKPGGGGQRPQGSVTFDGSNPLAWGQNAEKLAAGQANPQ
jgi:hypothetical protein